MFLCSEIMKNFIYLKKKIVLKGGSIIFLEGHCFDCSIGINLLDLSFSLNFFLWKREVLLI